MTIVSKLLVSSSSFVLLVGNVSAEDKSVKTQAETSLSFEVSDLPREEPIEGQLGEPGAPSLKEQQKQLAKSMLERGICNASYFGEAFCKEQEASAASKTFRVTEQFGSGSAGVKATTQE